MSKVKLSPQRAAAGVQAVLDGIERIEEELERLESRIQTLESAWDGEAREAFSRATREWTASVKELHAIARAASTTALGSVARIHELDLRRAGAWQ